jgi:hypothetical protein
MKQNLHDKAFVPFVCLVGKSSVSESVRIMVENRRPKKIFTKRDEFGL